MRYLALLCCLACARNPAPVTQACTVDTAAVVRAVKASLAEDARWNSRPVDQP